MLRKTIDEMPANSIMKEKWTFIVVTLLGALCLMIDAFYNGYPLVYSDTSTYIACGFELETPFDRPITYGLFLRATSLNGVSLWTVIFSQAFLLSGLIMLVTREFIDRKNYKAIGLITTLVLSLFTGVSWTVSQLMPDIFTAIGFMLILLIAVGKFDRRVRIGLYVLFFISCAMHISHVLLFTLLLILLFAFRRLLIPKEDSSFIKARLIVMLALSIGSFATMSSAVSKSKHMFFMGAMVEHGIAKKYLDENCLDGKYQLCAYKDSLPKRAYDFVWDEHSPVYKMGGWKATKTEFNEIIRHTLTTPRYIGMHIQESLKATADQLSLFAIGDGNGSFSAGTLLHQRVGQHFPRELSRYKRSLQNKNALDLIASLNLVFYSFMIISAIALLLLLMIRKNTVSQRMKFLILVTIGGILLNAWDCGTFANAIDRMGCKVMWLVPFLTILLGLIWLFEEKIRTES